MSRVARNPQGRPGRQRGMLGGGLWVLGSRLVVALTQVVTLGLLARLLAPDAMGVYFIIANLVIITSTVAQLGIPQLVVKRSAEALEAGDRAQVRQVMQGCLWLALAAALTFGAIFMAGLGKWLAEHVFHSPEMLPLLWLTAIWLIAMALQRSVGEAFRGLHDMRAASVFAGAFSGIVIAATLLFLVWFWGECSLSMVLKVSAGAMVVSLVASLALLQRRVQLFRAPFALPDLGLLRLALPIFFASLGNIVLTRADIWLLGMFASDSEVALYGGAARIIGLLGTAQLIAVALTGPVIAQLNQRGDMRQLQKVIQLVPTVLALPTLVVIAGLVLWGDYLMAVLYGDAFYAGGLRVLQILAIGQGVALLAGVSVQVLLMTNQQRNVMIITLSCTLLALVGTLFTVDAYGITAVAFWFAIAVAMQALLALIVCRLRLKLDTWIWPPALLHIGALRQLLQRRRPA